jgi:hypothetical protein
VKEITDMEKAITELAWVRALSAEDVPEAEVGSEEELGNMIVENRMTRSWGRDIMDDAELEKALAHLSDELAEKCGGEALVQMQRGGEERDAQRRRMVERLNEFKRGTTVEELTK